MSTDPNEGQNLNSRPPNAQQEDSQGVRNRALTYTEVANYALASLGFPVMNVEAETQQLKIFADRTLKEYSRWMPLYKFDVLTNVTSAINKYDLRELNKPFGREIIDVEILAKNNFFSPISGVFALGIPHPISHLSPDQYVLALMYIKTARKAYSSAPDWEWEEPVLWLYSPTGYGGPFQAAYAYTQDCSRFEDVPDRDHTWVQDYFYNLVKRAVGEARGKFGGIPGPARQNLRGQEMIDEARQELAELTASLKMRAYSRAPMFGLNEKF